MSGWESTWKIKEVIGIDIWIMNYPGREREECGWKAAHYALTGCWPSVPSVLFLDLGSGFMNIGTIKIKLYIYAFCVFLYVCSTSLQSIKNIKCLIS